MAAQADESNKGKGILEVAQMIVAQNGVSELCVKGTLVGVMRVAYLCTFRFRTPQIGSLYQGLKAQIVCLACSNFVYFYTYNSLKVL